MSILDGAVEQHVGPDGRFGMRLQRPLVNPVFGALSDVKSMRRV